MAAKPGEEELQEDVKILNAELNEVSSMSSPSDSFKRGEQEPQEAVKILEAKLHEVSSMSSSSNPFIFRAPRRLRQVNSKVLEPQIISIGPYHRNKDHLKAMEIHKVRYLRNFLQRTAKRSEKYVDASISMEKNVRDCHAETVEMSSTEFLVMMVLDGLFILELIHQFTMARLVEENDDIFKQDLSLTILAQDLLLVENQLPFFVLSKFLEITQILGSRYGEAIVYFFSKTGAKFQYKGTKSCSFS
ncbi:hypothetical protein DITRI_Ditri06bG0147400 [Diplodiscus trichospermus]